MATLDTTRGPGLRAVSRALDTAIEAAVAGRASHRSGTTFIPADVAVPARARRPYVVVHADGSEEVHPRTHVKVFVGLGIAAVVLWLIGRESV